ncbi:hypothetical protein MHI37_16055 [Paenibacillus sp. FSL H8-0548]|uniref:hypothetical protein n=1 Tax=Paenibacillus sp. FSL H8-0548 TaxID=1920422 RepID=UPI0015C3CF9A|nr:hypothetical protein [Paenibacillus sp. FSL H8-0548]
MAKKKGGKKMATQIAATPILKGKDAQNLLNSLNDRATEKSKANGKKLVNFFKAMEKGK